MPVPDPIVEIPGYEIERELGRGGMGVVYLAHQKSLRRRVALKVITPTYASDAIFRKRFQREAEHAASIDHENVVPVFDASESDGHLYLAMRYVEGTDLGEVLASRGRLSGHEAARIASQVGAALDAAHANGLIHRDVKPGNILVAGGEPDGHVYLTDFGLTKDGGTQSSLTNTGGWAGTVDYVAPEQMNGDRVDARTDVYALACVLYQMLAGQPPYAGSDAQKMWAHMNHEAPTMRDGDPGVAQSFDPVIARGMAKDPEARWPSAGDLGRTAVAAATGGSNPVAERTVAAGAALAGLPANATQPSPGGPPPPYRGDLSPPRAPTRPEPEPATTPDGPTRSGPGRVLTVAAVAVALAAGVVGGAVLFSALGEETDSTTVSTVEEANGSPDSDAGAGDDDSSSDGASSDEETSSDSSTGGSVPTDQLTFASYTPADPAYSYSAELPSGGGWSQPVESFPTGGELLRTTVRGPNGLFVAIDRTPSEIPQLGGDFDSSGTIPHPEFGAATEYVISESDLIPECNNASCVDYLIEDGQGGGWGVIAGGPDLAVARQIAQQVATSIEGAG